MCEILRLERFNNTPWGFRLTGGYDFGAPLSVVKVAGGSIAAQSGVKVGDIVLEINGQSTKHFIHTDAQNFIGISGNHLTLTIMRGSLVTPPDVTPLRGRTPVYEDESEMHKNNIDAHILNERLERTIENGVQEDDGYKDAPILHENIGIKAEIKNNVQTKFEGEILSSDVSEIELDEVLTGNEEVLDEGVIGINFKKFFPQVDFIRESEVFKFLQNENTKKEVSEQVQLLNEPTKRFSTFLQKPKPPPPKPQGPLWHYPKAPNYLPRETEKEVELPKRRIRHEKEHTVLWLFLGESGEHVVDERWGSEAEERINLSRCEMHEDDTMSLVSSIATGQSGRDSRLDKSEDVVVKETKVEESELKAKETSVEQERITLDDASEDTRHSEIVVNNIESKLEHTENEEVTGQQTFKSVQHTQEEEEEEIETAEIHKKQFLNESFTKQIADIQAQISAIEIQAPSDLQTQLFAIQDQLSKIVDVKSTHIETVHHALTDEQIKREEYYKDERTKVEEEEKCLAELSENYCEYTFEVEATINGRKDSSDEDHLEEGREYNQSAENHLDDTDNELDVQNEIEMQMNGDECVRFEKGEYELCETPRPTPVKKSAHPITPQKRPIVLPGGRMWRQPKDACHDDFYQGILVAQAEVMIGNTGGVNFTKYVPPKFDMSHSAVYKLVREIEDKTKALEQDKEQEYYHTPIDKRHFYNATLREPDPVGGIDL